MGKFGAAHLKFDKDYLNELTTVPDSGVFKRNCKYHIALHPAQFNDFGQSIKDELGRKIGKYDDIFQGIMLGYENVKLQSDLGVIGLENCYVHIDVHADFFVFKPEIDKVLKGIVTRTTRDHVGCLVYSTFNISLPKLEHENNDNWIGNKVTVNSEVEFKIIFVDLSARLPYIRGQLLSVVKLHENAKKAKKLNKQIKFEEDENFDEIEEEEVKPKKSKKKHTKFDNQDEVENMDIKEEFDEIEEQIEPVKKSKKHKKKHKKEHDEQDEKVIRKKEKRKEKKRKQEENVENLSMESLHIKSMFDDSYAETNNGSQNIPFNTLKTEDYPELNGIKPKKKKSKSVVKDEIFEGVEEEQYSEQLETSPKKERKLEEVKMEDGLEIGVSKKKKRFKSFSNDDNTHEEIKEETINELEENLSKSKKKRKDEKRKR